MVSQDIDTIVKLCYSVFIMAKKIALFGLGPHARRIYYPYLEKLMTDRDDVSLEIVVDLDINKEYIEKWLENRSLQPKS